MKKILILITGLLFGLASLVNAQTTIYSHNFDDGAFPPTATAESIWVLTNGTGNVSVNPAFDWYNSGAYITIDPDAADKQVKVLTATIERTIPDPWVQAKYMLSFRWNSQTSLNIADPLVPASNASIKAYIRTSTDGGVTWGAAQTVYDHQVRTTLEETTVIDGTSTTLVWADYTGGADDATWYFSQIPISSYLNSANVTHYQIEFVYSATNMGSFNFDDVAVTEEESPYIQAGSQNFIEDFSTGVPPNSFWELTEDASNVDVTEHWKDGGNMLYIDPTTDLSFKYITATVTRLIPDPWVGSNSFLEFDWNNDVVSNMDATADVKVQIKTSTDGGATWSTSWTDIWNYKNQAMLEATSTDAWFVYDEYANGDYTFGGPMHAKVNLNPYLYNGTVDRIQIRMLYKGDDAGWAWFDNFNMYEVEIPTLDYTQDFNSGNIIPEPNWAATNGDDNVGSTSEWYAYDTDGGGTEYVALIEADTDVANVQHKLLTATISRNIPDPWLGADYLLSFDWTSKITRIKGGSDPYTDPGATITVEVRTSTNLGNAWTAWTKVWDVKDRDILTATTTTPGFDFDDYLMNGDDVTYNAEVDLNALLNNGTVNQIQVRFNYKGVNAGYFAFDNFEVTEDEYNQFDLKIHRPAVYSSIPSKQLSGTYIAKVDVQNNGIATFDDAPVFAYVHGGQYNGANIFGYNTVKTADFTGTTYPKSKTYEMTTAGATRAIEFDQIGNYFFNADATINGAYSSADEIYITIDDEKYSRAYYVTLADRLDTKTLSAEGDVAGYGSLFQLHKRDKFKGTRARFNVPNVPYRWSLLKLASPAATTSEVVYQSELLYTPAGAPAWGAFNFADEKEYITLEPGYYMIFVSQQSTTGYELVFDNKEDGEYYQGTPSSLTKVTGNGNAYIEMRLQVNRAPEFETPLTTSFVLSVGVPFSYKFAVTEKDGDDMAVNPTNLTPWLNDAWLSHRVVDGILEIYGTPTEADVTVGRRITLSDGIDSTWNDFTFEVINPNMVDAYAEPVALKYDENFATDPIGDRGWNLAWGNHTSDVRWSHSGSATMEISSSDSIQTEKLLSPAIILPEIVEGDSIFMSFDWITKYTDNGGVRDYADIKLEVFKYGTNELVATLWDDDNEEVITATTYEQTDPDKVLIEWPYQDNFWYTSRFNITDWAQDSIYVVFTYTDLTEGKAASFEFTNLLVEHVEGEIDLSVKNLIGETPLVSFSLPYTSIPYYQMAATQNEVSVNVANLGSRLAENALVEINVQIDSLQGNGVEDFNVISALYNVAGKDTLNIPVDAIEADIASEWTVSVAVNHEDDVDGANDAETINLSVSNNELRKHNGSRVGWVSKNDETPTLAVNFDVYAADVLQEVGLYIEAGNAGRKFILSLVKDGKVLFNTDEMEITANWEAMHNFKLDKPYNIEPGQYSLLITYLPAPSYFNIGYDDDGGEVLRGTAANLFADEEIDGDLMVNIYLYNDAPEFNPNPTSSEVMAQTEYVLNLGAIDRNKHALTFVAYNIPSWATFTDNGNGTAKLAGTPEVNDIGTNYIELWVSDGRDSTRTNFTIDVLPNAFPSFTSAPTTYATQGVAYSYTAVAADPYEDDVTVSVVTVPAWITATVAADGNSVALAGTPAAANVGANYVKLRVVDEYGYDNYQTFTVMVLPNAAPTIVSAPTIRATVGEVYLYNVLAKDDNADDVITITSAETLPTWLTLTATGASAVLTGTPTVAINDTITLVATDLSGATATQEFIIVVEAVNDAPVFATTEPVTAATELSVYDMTIEATDANGDALTFSLNAPSWLVITNIGNGKAYLRGTPMKANVGDNAVVVTVSDGELTDELSFTIAVAAKPNDAPVFTSNPITAVQVSKQYSYTVEVVDNDQDAVQLSAVVPAWLTFVDNNDGTGTLYGIPADMNKGVSSITITANDGTVVSTQNFNVDVAGMVQAADYKVYPNPATERIYVDAVEDATIKVFDLLGRNVYETISTSSVTTIEVSNLPKGVYIVKVTSVEGETVAKRINIKR